MLGAACDKKDPAPIPPLAQVSQGEPAKPPAPDKPSAPDLDRAREADQGGLSNRTQATQQQFALMERGDFAMAFKRFTDSVHWTEVGLPDGEFDSVTELIAFQRSSRTGFSDFKIKPQRIIEAADYEVVEYVWSARHTGAFADGTPATNKVATLPGAMLIHYKTPESIDQVWVFHDWPSVLQQLGLAPGLPEGFEPHAMPAKSEIITGAAEPRYQGRYRDFLTGLGPDAYESTLRDQATDDLSWFDTTAGKVLSGRVAAATHLGGRSRSFTLVKSEIQTAIGVGLYFAAFTKNELLYKGGFMNVAADGQKVTTHTLDIVQFDAPSLRFKRLASYGNSYETLAALRLSAASTVRPANADAKLGVKACDGYVAKIRECGESLDGNAKQAMLIAMDSQVHAWASVADGATRDERLTQACDAALTAAKGTFQATCPRVVWR